MTGPGETERFRRAAVAAELAGAGGDRGDAPGRLAPPRRTGVARIVSNDGDGDYTITEQHYDPDDDDWADAVAETGYVEAAARDFRGRPVGAAEQGVFFWEQWARGSKRELLIDASRASAPFLVLVTKDGGADLDGSLCDYTYTAKGLDDSTGLGTGLTPAAERMKNIKYWYAGEDRGGGLGTTSRYALAAYHDGALKLLVCFGEVAKTGDCA